ncbi:serine/threonine-protein kinase M1, variant 2 [Orbilia brochopaga]
MICSDDYAFHQMIQSNLQLITGDEWQFQSPALRLLYDRVTSIHGSSPEPLGSVDAGDLSGPRKRRKLDPGGEPSEASKARRASVSRLFSKLGGRPSNDLTGLSAVAADGFAKLSIQEKSEVFQEIGKLVCLRDDETIQQSTADAADQIHVPCAACDAARGILMSEGEPQPSDELLQIFAAIQKSDVFFHSSNVRAYGMRAMRKIIRHGSAALNSKLSDHSFGQWCVQALRSSNSDLRLLAVMTLPHFSIFSENDETSRAERTACLLRVREISSTSDDTIQETCIIAWGRISRVLEGDDLHLALGLLLGYLGHSNTYLAAVAYNEIEAVAQAKNISMSTLLSQFMRDLSVVVVSLLRTKPQVIQSVSTLLGTSTQDFLANTISYTLPHMIMNRKTDVLDSLVQAYNSCRKGAPESLFEVCMHYITAILGLLFVQPHENVEEYAMSLLVQTDRTFQRLGLSELIKADPIAIMAETIRCYAVLDEGSKPNAQKAIRNIATVCYKKATKKEKNVDMLQSFFEAHVLGIITQYSDVLFSVRVKHSMSEKRRNLKAIGDMIRLGKIGIISGLPQISACLSSTLDVKGLQETAIAGWSAFMAELPSIDVTPYFPVVFCLLLKHWGDFDESSRKLSANLVTGIFERHWPALQEEADVLPLLNFDPAFKDYERRLANSRRSDLKERLRILALRSTHENPLVVEQALVELKQYLETNEQFIRSITNDEIPDSIVAEVIRSLLDACVKHSHSQNLIPKLSSECLGIIGAVDPNRIEKSRRVDDLMILHNFEQTEECVQFAHFLLEHHLVGAFLSATDTRAQGFLSYAMQELLKFCNFNAEVLTRQRAEVSLAIQRRWNDFSVTARNVLSPYLSSKYVLSTVATTHKPVYPIFSPRKSYREWLTELLLDLLPKAQGVHTKSLFADIISKIVKGQDLSILNFILPNIVLHIIISGTSEDRENICLELLSILQYEMPVGKNQEFEMVKRCSESVFILVDHMSKWIRERRRYNANVHAQIARHSSEAVDRGPDASIVRVEAVLAKLPAKLIGERSIQCQSYSRALFYWEQYMRKCRSKQANMEPLYTQMQSIYAEIDEPDGVEGISTKLSVVNVEQQILEHRKAGRWLAVQSWYEHLLKDKPADVDLQYGLLLSLKESGQDETLLVHLEPILNTHTPLLYQALDFGIESAWRSLNWEKLEVLLHKCPESARTSFNVTIGRAINAFRSNDMAALEAILRDGREHLTRSMTLSATNSIRSCHERLFQFQALAECHYITTTFQHESPDFTAFKQTLDARLTLLGPSHREKQYILALRRALLTVSRGFNDFTVPYTSSLWLTTAKLARKKKDYHQAFTAILNSNDAQNGPIEQAKLAWDEGRHRKAIKLLENAIETNIFEVTISTTGSFQDTDASESRKRHPQSSAKARAMLLWARWMDSAGQIQSKVLVHKFREVARSYSHWEKGHFYLGRHYNNILKTERALPPTKRPQSFLIGETVKLVCTNYMRAMMYGTRYIFQTLPQFLNLWLDFGADQEREFESDIGTEEFRNHLSSQRSQQIQELHTCIRKLLLQNTPVFVYLTALPQIMSRVGIKSDITWLTLEKLITKILTAYPQHTLWSIIAVSHSTQEARRLRAGRILHRLKSERSSTIDLKTLIPAATKLMDALLKLCNFEIKGKPSHVSLRDDIGFPHSVAPVALIIPVQTALTVSFPADGLTGKHGHDPFARDQATISKFEDEADVMTSLQKPRKITIIGSDGRRYPLMCKPKDDLRKDARLMDFNTIINRLLKKDDESSRRQLQIRTYAVTPLNEECGLIEWVNNLRPLRDILLKSYKNKNISVNYAEVRLILDDACSDPSKYHLFNDAVVPRFPDVFHEWFVETFPEPETWFAARLAYVRTTAVISMVGYILGLGDRHGENILYDEATGETQHVDFNCLFDKGLTFEKPERVPFRLTHNMVDAMGLTGYEGPFRRSSEIVMRVLRLNEESLMTVVETFLHDPLVEWLTVKKRRTPNISKVPDNPRDVLESIENKLRGLHAGDPIPLSVEGQVQELIQQAVSVENLVHMYIGWCAYF